MAIHLLTTHKSSACFQLPFYLLLTVFLTPIPQPATPSPQLFLLWILSLAILLILVLLGMFKDIIRTYLNICSTGQGKHRRVLSFQSFPSATLNGLKHGNSLGVMQFSHCSSVQNSCVSQWIKLTGLFQIHNMYQKCKYINIQSTS